MKTNKRTFGRLLLAAIVGLAVAGCVGNGIYSQYQPVGGDGGWHKDSLAVFDVAVSDTLTDYDVIVNIRNRNEYPYQNLYLFITSLAPNGIAHSDTINCILADEKGKWYGSGIGSVSDLPILYMERINFPQKGTYHFEIRQGMREKRLKGINDIGLKVTPSSKEK